MYSRITLFSIACVVALGIMLGFSIGDDPNGSRTPASITKQFNSSQTDVNAPQPVAPTSAIIFVDSCNGNNDTTSLKARGYKIYYRSGGPQGASALWYQGVETVFPAYNGPGTGYIAANYNVVTGANNIDNWLISQRLNITAGDSLMFWERSVTGNTFPDSMRIMYSAVGDSTPEATSWVELGRFLNTITGSWFQRKYRLATAGPNARFALRYNVVDGGPLGANSNYIGIDMITVSSSGAPSCAYNWASQTSGTTTFLYSVSAVSDIIGWAGGASGTVRRTTDGGTTWGNGNPNPGVISGDIYNIYAWSANDAICTTSPGGTYIYKTTNGGTNWTQVYFLAGTAAFLDGLQMISPTEGYGLGDPVAAKWMVVKTTDGGNTWARMATEPTPIGGEAGWNNSFQIVGTHMWFGTNGTRVYHSTNLGVTWTNAATTGTVNSYAVHYNNATNGLAAGTATVKSVDGGTTYTSTGSPGTVGNIFGLEGAGTDWWAIRSDANVYRSTNQGANWTTAYTLAGQVWNHINFKVVAGCPVGWAVSTTGGIAKMSTVTGISNYNTEVPAAYNLSQNYPNPFNPSTNIKFSIPKSGLVTLKIYDMLGKEVASLVNEFKNAGNYLVGFNASNLATGTYIYRIESADFVETKKMLLVK